MDSPKNLDVIVIGGGQSGLACGFYLRRTGLKYLILDDQETCGGSWNHAWDSLTLFSPSEQSSLPGWTMPPSKGGFPVKQEVIDYLCNYEKRYKLKVQRPVEVLEVQQEEGLFNIKTSQGEFTSKAVIASTGSWKEPYIPPVAGRKTFKGHQVHTASYQNGQRYKNESVLIVGEGNSGAQILAEVSKVARTSWATLNEPSFLPDDVDGRVLFGEATAKYYAQKKGEPYTPADFTLGNIVMLPPLKDARDRGVLKSNGSISKIWEEGVIWDNGKKEKFDAIIWSTGFRYATSPLASLVKLTNNGKVNTTYTKATETAGLWLVGYGNWTGFASATLIGVGRSARRTVDEVSKYLGL